MDWKLFGSTFVLIFVSELPDKTAFASVILATRNRPLPVFCGAAGAFVVQSFVAVTFGSLLTLLPANWIRIGAGVLFLILAVLMWCREQPTDSLHITDGPRGGFVKTMTSAFVIIFIAEWGDLTQLATAAISAKYASPITIFTSATLALWTVSGIGVLVGHSAKHTLEPTLLRRIAAIAFAAVGTALLMNLP